MADHALPQAVAAIWLKSAVVLAPPGHERKSMRHQMDTQHDPALGDRDSWGRVSLGAHLILAPASLASLFVIHHSGGRPWQVTTVALAAVGLHTGVVLARHRPWTGFVTTSLAMLGLVLTPMPGWPPTAFPSAACFLLTGWHLTRTGDRRARVCVLVTSLVGVGLAELLEWHRMPLWVPVWARVLEAAVLAGIVLTVWGVAVAVTRRRELAAAVERAHTEAVRDAERATIRRDLHDVIAHSITVMVARVEAAAATTGDTRARHELADIAETGRDALDGLRAMLAVLGAKGLTAQDLPLSMDALPVLVEAAATPLHSVSLTETGARRALSINAEAALVRVVQESITNALRHLHPPVDVQVRLRWESTHVVVTVHDDGGSGTRHANAPGSGLIGAQERVHAAGGTFRVQPGKGWSVEARLPAKVGR
ncbi:histidine kinase [Micromonospora sp. WMMA1363]|uniref:sensor histidine kinase n=1 Tax=Micromonospora sp. WMMA1363 TaxID=3053985 RepID=UPI00259CF4D2|nr:histidine kinase [Micromonospora sp. WMMA1363]MDM4721991.1 histidine kinase [Micromonospora sp. WMMA1363]